MHMDVLWLGKENCKSSVKFNNLAQLSLAENRLHLVSSELDYAELSIKHAITLSAQCRIVSVSKGTF